MDTCFTKEFLVREQEVDRFNNMSPLVLLRFLQEVAGDHARQLGVSVSELQRHGLTWVLSRMHVQVFRSVGAGSRLLIRSWPSNREGVFSCREFEVYTDVGDKVALATSSWAVIDLETRRPVRLTEELLSFPLNPRRAIIDPFQSLPRVLHGGHERTCTVDKADLDLNCHVNNVVYARWVLESLTGAVRDNYRLCAIELGFRAEAFADEDIVVVSEPQSPAENDCWLHRVSAVNDGRELVRARTAWINNQHRIQR